MCAYKGPRALNQEKVWIFCNTNWGVSWPLNLDQGSFREGSCQVWEKHEEAWRWHSWGGHIQIVQALPWRGLELGQEFCSFAVLRPTNLDFVSPFLWSSGCVHLQETKIQESVAWRSLVLKIIRVYLFSGFPLRNASVFIFKAIKANIYKVVTMSWIPLLMGKLRQESLYNLPNLP